MVKIVICLLWQCNYFILVRNNLAFLHAYLCCLMKILLPNSSTWFSRGLKVRIWCSSVCIHVKQISAGTAGNQLTMTPVFQMFWQNCFLETNLGTGNVEQVFIWMKTKVLAANSLQVCEFLQCACHAGQLTLSWLQHLCQLKLAAAKTHRATWVRTRPSQLSEQSKTQVVIKTLLKVDLRPAGLVLGKLWISSAVSRDWSVWRRREGRRPDMSGLASWGGATAASRCQPGRFCK